MELARRLRWLAITAYSLRAEQGTIEKIENYIARQDFNKLTASSTAQRYLLDMSNTQHFELQ